MKFFKQAFSYLYHIWYYLVMLVVILTISPFIFITSLKEDRYQNFFWWARLWGKSVLFLMGIRVRKFQSAPLLKGQQYIICANHSSELDIMMCLALVPNCFVFIGKKELAKLPLFGYFYKRTNILVDRNSISSKRSVLEKAAKKLNQGIGVCIYPEGGIPDNYEVELAPFKMGAFKLAIEQQVSILSISFPDNKRRFNDDWKIGSPGVSRAIIHRPLHTEGLTINDIHRLKDDCYRQIQSGLRPNATTLPPEVIDVVL